MLLTTQKRDELIEDIAHKETLEQTLEDLRDWYFERVVSQLDLLCDADVIKYAKEREFEGYA